MSEAERQGIIDLVHDLPAVWRAKTTTHAERKHVVRLLIKDVMLTKLEKAVRVDVRWQTHACNTLEVPRPKPAYVARRTAPEVIECIRQWALDHTDIEIAERLNQEGYRSGQGSAFTASKVDWLRYAYGIKSGCPLGRRPVPAGSAVMVAIVRGRQPISSTLRSIRLQIGAKRGNSMGASRASRPRWVQLTPELILALHKPVRQFKPRQAAKATVTHLGRHRQASSA